MAISWAESEKRRGYSPLPDGPVTRPLLFRTDKLSSQDWQRLLITELGDHAMTPLQQLHHSHGHTLLFKHGQRVTVPCRESRRLGTVTDETANVVWVLRDDQPTASPYFKREVEVVND
jgi:hypothetical protein